MLMNMCSLKIKNRNGVIVYNQLNVKWETVILLNRIGSNFSLTKEN